MRRGARRWLAALAGTVVLALTASVAHAQGPLPGSSNPLSPTLPAPPVTVPTSAPTPTIINTSSTSSNDSGLSGTGAIAIAIGAIVVLAAISLFIWRDARRRAPVRQRAAAATAGATGRPGSKQRGKPRKLSPAERRRRKRGRAR